MTLEVEKMFGTAVGELERMLSSRAVVGEPIQINGATLIPLVSIGFGFGAGGGEGQEPSGKAQGNGGGTGGGGGVKPVGLIVVDKDGVRLETLKSAGASAWGQVAQSVVAMTSKRGNGAPPTAPSAS